MEDIILAISLSAIVAGVAAANTKCYYLVS